MTEQEWLAWAKPTPMLEYLRCKVSDRKFRLYACACLRRVWPLLTGTKGRHFRKAVELVEKYVDGVVSGLEEFQGSYLWADNQFYADAAAAAKG